MEHTFWHARWERNEIGFHEADVHPYLIAHFKALNVAHNARIFVPLCGKTRDISWLLAQGYHVIGAELSERAVKELFNELEMTPQITQIDGLIHYQTDTLEVFVGDIFDLTNQHLGHIDTIYDRAALVALPATTRNHYAAHLVQLTNTAPQLLITYEYDQLQMDGPPFALMQSEVRQHYTGPYQLEIAEDMAVAGGLKGHVPTRELAWLLTEAV